MIYNKQGKDNGMVICAYIQGGNWVADIINDKHSCWVNFALHYSIRHKRDVIEWAKNEADGQKFQLIFN